MDSPYMVNTLRWFFLYPAGSKSGKPFCPGTVVKEQAQATSLRFFVADLGKKIFCGGMTWRYTEQNIKNNSV